MFKEGYWSRLASERQKASQGDRRSNASWHKHCDDLDYDDALDNDTLNSRIPPSRPIRVAPMTGWASSRTFPHARWNLAKTHQPAPPVSPISPTCSAVERTLLLSRNSRFSHHLTSLERNTHAASCSNDNARISPSVSSLASSSKVGACATVCKKENTDASDKVRVDMSEHRVLQQECNGGHSSNFGPLSVRHIAGNASRSSPRHSSNRVKSLLSSSTQVYRGAGMGNEVQRYTTGSSCSSTGNARRSFPTAHHDDGAGEAGHSLGKLSEHAPVAQLSGQTTMTLPVLTQVYEITQEDSDSAALTISQARRSDGNVVPLELQSRSGGIFLSSVDENENEEKEEFRLRGNDVGMTEQNCNGVQDRASPKATQVYGGASLPATVRVDDSDSEAVDASQPSRHRATCQSLPDAAQVFFSVQNVPSIPATVCGNYSETGRSFDRRTSIAVAAQQSGAWASAAACENETEEETLRDAPIARTECDTELRLMQSSEARISAPKTRVSEASILVVSDEVKSGELADDASSIPATQVYDAFVPVIVRDHDVRSRPSLGTRESLSIASQVARGSASSIPVVLDDGTPVARQSVDGRKFLPVTQPYDASVQAEICDGEAATMQSLGSKTPVPTTQRHGSLTPTEVGEEKYMSRHSLERRNSIAATQMCGSSIREEVSADEHATRHSANERKSISMAPAFDASTPARVYNNEPPAQETRDKRKSIPATQLCVDLAEVYDGVPVGLQSPGERKSIPATLACGALLPVTVHKEEPPRRQPQGDRKPTFATEACDASIPVTVCNGEPETRHSQGNRKSIPVTQVSGALMPSTAYNASRPSLGDRKSISMTQVCGQSLAVTMQNDEPTRQPLDIRKSTSATQACGASMSMTECNDDLARRQSLDTRNFTTVSQLCGTSIPATVCDDDPATRHSLGERKSIPVTQPCGVSTTKTVYYDEPAAGRFLGERKSISTTQLCGASIPATVYDDEPPTKQLLGEQKSMSVTQPCGVSTPRTVYNDEPTKHPLGERKSEPISQFGESMPATVCDDEPARKRSLNERKSISVTQPCDPSIPVTLHEPTTKQSLNNRKSIPLTQCGAPIFLSISDDELGTRHPLDNPKYCLVDQPCAASMPVTVYEDEPVSRQSSDNQQSIPATQLCGASILGMTYDDVPQTRHSLDSRDSLPVTQLCAAPMPLLICDEEPATRRSLDTHKSISVTQACGASISGAGYDNERTRQSLDNVKFMPATQLCAASIPAIGYDEPTTRQSLEKRKSVPLTEPCRLSIPVVYDDQPTTRQSLDNKKSFPETQLCKASIPVTGYDEPTRQPLDNRKSIPVTDPFGASIPVTEYNDEPATRQLLSNRKSTSVTQPCRASIPVTEYAEPTTMQSPDNRKSFPMTELCGTLRLGVLDDEPATRQSLDSRKSIPVTELCGASTPAVYDDEPTTRQSLDKRKSIALTQACGASIPTTEYNDEPARQSHDIRTPIPAAKPCGASIPVIYDDKPITKKSLDIKKPVLLTEPCEALIQVAYDEEPATRQSLDNRKSITVTQPCEAFIPATRSNDKPTKQSLDKRKSIPVTEPCGVSTPVMYDEEPPTFQSVENRKSMPVTQPCGASMPAEENDEPRRRRSLDCRKSIAVTNPCGALAPAVYEDEPTTTQSLDNRSSIPVTQPCRASIPAVCDDESTNQSVGNRKSIPLAEPCATSILAVHNDEPTTRQSRDKRKPVTVTQVCGESGPGITCNDEPVTQHLVDSRKSISVTQPCVTSIPAVCDDEATTTQSVDKQISIPVTQVCGESVPGIAPNDEPRTRHSVDSRESISVTQLCGASIPDGCDDEPTTRQSFGNRKSITVTQVCGESVPGIACNDEPVTQHLVGSRESISVTQLCGTSIPAVCDDEASSRQSLDKQTSIPVTQMCGESVPGIAPNDEPRTRHSVDSRESISVTQLCGTSIPAVCDDEAFTRQSLDRQTSIPVTQVCGESVPGVAPNDEARTRHSVGSSKSISVTQLCGTSIPAVCDDEASSRQSLDRQTSILVTQMCGESVSGIAPNDEPRTRHSVDSRESISVTQLCGASIPEGCDDEPTTKQALDNRKSMTVTQVCGESLPGIACNDEPVTQHLVDNRESVSVTQTCGAIIPVVVSNTATTRQSLDNRKSIQVTQMCGESAPGIECHDEPTTRHSMDSRKSISVTQLCGASIQVVRDVDNSSVTHSEIDRVGGELTIPTAVQDFDHNFASPRETGRNASDSTVPAVVNVGNNAVPLTEIDRVESKPTIPTTVHEVGSNSVPRSQADGVGSEPTIPKVHDVGNSFVPPTQIDRVDDESTISTAMHDVNNFAPPAEIDTVGSVPTISTTVQYADHSFAPASETNRVISEPMAPAKVQNVDHNPASSTEIDRVGSEPTISTTVQVVDNNSAPPADIDTVGRKATLPTAARDAHNTCAPPSEVGTVGSEPTIPNAEHDVDNGSAASAVVDRTGRKATLPTGVQDVDSTFAAPTEIETVCRELSIPITAHDFDNNSAPSTEINRVGSEPTIPTTVHDVDNNSVPAAEIDRVGSEPANPTVVYDADNTSVPPTEIDGIGSEPTMLGTVHDFDNQSSPPIETGRNASESTIPTIVHNVDRKSVLRTEIDTLGGELSIRSTMHNVGTSSFPFADTDKVGSESTIPTTAHDADSKFGPRIETDVIGCEQVVPPTVHGVDNHSPLNTAGESGGLSNSLGQPVRLVCIDQSILTAEHHCSYDASIHATNIYEHDGSSGMGLERAQYDNCLSLSDRDRVGRELIITKKVRRIGDDAPAITSKRAKCDGSVQPGCNLDGCESTIPTTGHGVDDGASKISLNRAKCEQSALPTTGDGVGNSASKVTVDRICLSLTNRDEATRNSTKSTMQNVDSHAPVIATERTEDDSKSMPPPDRDEAAPKSTKSSSNDPDNHAPVITAERTEDDSNLVPPPHRNEAAPKPSTRTMLDAHNHAPVIITERTEDDSNLAPPNRDEAASKSSARTISAHDLPSDARARRLKKSASQADHISVRTRGSSYDASEQPPKRLHIDAPTPSWSERIDLLLRSPHDRPDNSMEHSRGHLPCEGSSSEQMGVSRPYRDTVDTNRPRVKTPLGNAIGYQTSGVKLTPPTLPRSAFIEAARASNEHGAYVVGASESSPHSSDASRSTWKVQPVQTSVVSSVVQIDIDDLVDEMPTNHLETSEIHSEGGKRRTQHEMTHEGNNPADEHENSKHENALPSTGPTPAVNPAPQSSSPLGQPAPLAGTRRDLLAPPAACVAASLASGGNSTTLLQTPAAPLTQTSVNASTPQFGRISGSLGSTHRTSSSLFRSVPSQSHARSHYTFGAPPAADSTSQVRRSNETAAHASSSPGLLDAMGASVGSAEANGREVRGETPCALMGQARLSSSASAFPDDATNNAGDEGGAASGAGVDDSPDGRNMVGGIAKDCSQGSKRPRSIASTLPDDAVVGGNVMSPPEATVGALKCGKGLLSTTARTEGGPSELEPLQKVERRPAECGGRRKRARSIASTLPDVVCSSPDTLLDKTSPSPHQPVALSFVQGAVVNNQRNITRTYHAPERISRAAQPKQEHVATQLPGQRDTGGVPLTHCDAVELNVHQSQSSLRASREVQNARYVEDAHAASQSHGVLVRSHSEMVPPKGHASQSHRAIEESCGTVELNFQDSKERYTTPERQGESHKHDQGSPSFHRTDTLPTPTLEQDSLGWAAVSDDEMEQELIAQIHMHPFDVFLPDETLPPPRDDPSSVSGSQDPTPPWVISVEDPTNPTSPLGCQAMSLSYSISGACTGDSCLAETDVREEVPNAAARPKRRTQPSRVSLAAQSLPPRRLTFSPPRESNQHATASLSHAGVDVSTGPRAQPWPLPASPQMASSTGGAQVPPPPCVAQLPSLHDGAHLSSRAVSSPCLGGAQAPSPYSVRVSPPCAPSPNPRDGAQLPSRSGAQLSSPSLGGAQSPPLQGAASSPSPLGGAQSPSPRGATKLHSPCGVASSSLPRLIKSSSSSGVQVSRCSAGPRISSPAGSGGFCTPPRCSGSLSAHSPLLNTQDLDNLATPPTPPRQYALLYEVSIDDIERAMAAHESALAQGDNTVARVGGSPFAEVPHESSSIQLVATASSTAAPCVASTKSYQLPGVKCDHADTSTDNTALALSSRSCASAPPFSGNSSSTLSKRPVPPIIDDDTDIQMPPCSPILPLGPSKKRRTRKVSSGSRSAGSVLPPKRKKISVPVSAGSVRTHLTIPEVITTAEWRGELGGTQHVPSPVGSAPSITPNSTPRSRELVMIGFREPLTNTKRHELMRLNVTVHDTWTSSVHLCCVGPFLRQSPTLMCCLAAGVPLVSLEYLDACITANSWIDYEPFVIRDKFRATFDFDIPVVRGKQDRLLHKTRVFVTNKEDRDEMRPLLEACGAICLQRFPNKKGGVCYFGRAQDVVNAKAKGAPEVFSLDSLFNAVMRNSRDPLTALTPEGPNSVPAADTD